MITGDYAELVGVCDQHDCFGSGRALTKLPTSESRAWNVCGRTAPKMEKIAARNRIREEAGLPLLSIPRELRRMKQAADATAFERFAAVHRQSVWEEVLTRLREATGEPNWHPSTLESERLSQRCV